MATCLRFYCWLVSLCRYLLHFAILLCLSLKAVDDVQLICITFSTYGLSVYMWIIHWQSIACLVKSILLQAFVSNDIYLSYFPTRYFEIRLRFFLGNEQEKLLAFESNLNFEFDRVVKRISLNYLWFGLNIFSLFYLFFYLI